MIMVIKEFSLVSEYNNIPFVLKKANFSNGEVGIISINGCDALTITIS